MKTIYKIIIFIAFIAMIGTASAGTFSDAENDNDIHFSFPTMEFAKDGAIHHSYEKGTLTIPINPSNSISIKDWNYVDIEIT